MRLIRVLIVIVATSSPPVPPTVRRDSTRVIVETTSVSLALPVVHLRAPTGRSLVLVGTTHVADPSYYAAVVDTLGDRVWVTEGVTPTDPAPAPDADAWIDALAAHGLVPQQIALPEGIGADLTEAQLTRALAAAGAGDDAITDVMTSTDRRRLSDRLATTGSDPRLIALARLALLRSLAEPSPVTGPHADRYWGVIIGLRNRIAVATVTQLPADRIGLVYGADHTADLVARLSAEGWRVQEEAWLPALTVPYGPLGLGPVQIRQLLRDD